MRVLKRRLSLLLRSPKREGFARLVIALMVPSVKTSKWVGDCFIYTNSTNRLSYMIGDQSHVINHFDQ